MWGERVKGHVEERTAHCLGVVGELLREPLTGFPVDFLSCSLASTFDVTGVSWNWRQPDGSFGLSVTPGSLRHEGEGWDLWERGELFDIHPLVQWHLRTDDERPQSLGRVPGALVPRKDRMFLRRLTASFGCEEQLTIACRVHGTEHAAFVLGRSGCDFSDDDLLVARRIQPALAAVRRQVDLLDRLGLRSRPPAAEVGLTCREEVVLRLLSDGHSARAIARQLATSPRTVEKHLEHIYRKVHVNDRVNAVRVAREMGLSLRSNAQR
jgi:DNA-binding CsgD family transcriptional regulator